MPESASNLEDKRLCNVDPFYNEVLRMLGSAGGQCSCAGLTPVPRWQAMSTRAGKVRLRMPRYVNAFRSADAWSALSVATAPVSLWMRSDPEEQNDDVIEAVRLCRKGQALSLGIVGKDDRNSLHAIHFDLSCPDGGTPEIDLSAFGTPPGVSDEDVIVRKGRQGKGRGSCECLVFANPDQLIRFGDFSKELTVQAKRGVATYHAYVFAKTNRVSLTLFVVFADDGHEMAVLERGA